MVVVVVVALLLLLHQLHTIVKITLLPPLLPKNMMTHSLKWPHARDAGRAREQGAMYLQFENEQYLWGGAPPHCGDEFLSRHLLGGRGGGGGKG